MAWNVLLGAAIISAVNRAMANRLGRFLESVLFAGLKPDARLPQPAKRGRLARLREMIDRLVAGRAPTDPLYLTNRTWKQRLRAALLVAIPCVVLAAAGGLVLWAFLPGEPVRREPTAAEMLAKLMPDVERSLKASSNSEAEIADVRVVQGDIPRLSGFLSNKTKRTLSIEFTLDLSDANGTRLGSVTERVSDVPARAAAPFDFYLKQTGAALAVVRGIRTFR
jgi:hypothetical protein